MSSVTPVAVIDGWTAVPTAYRHQADRIEILRTSNGRFANRLGIAMVEFDIRACPSAAASPRGYGGCAAAPACCRRRRLADCLGRYLPIACRHVDAAAGLKADHAGLIWPDGWVLWGPLRSSENKTAKVNICRHVNVNMSR
jgi:hypothetical protein